MAAPRMSIAEVLVNGGELILMHLALLVLSGLSMGIGLAIIFDGEFSGIFLVLMGILILLAGYAGMLTKIIADGVSWGVHANSGKYAKENDLIVVSKVPDNTSFASRAKQELGPSYRGIKTSKTSIPQGVKICKECATPTDSKFQLRCDVCQGELI